MRKWILGLCALLAGVAIVVADADARRLGSGRSVGAQRSVTAPPATAPAKPAQAQQAAPQGNRWAGLFGALALGGLLGWALSGTGLSTILVLALLAATAVLGLRAFARRQPASEPVQLAGVGQENVVLSGQVRGAPTSGAAPAEFDTAGFLRAAKLNFVKLQLANDAGKLDEIREFTTSDLFEELRKDVLTRPLEAPQTDVVSLNADLLEVATERDSHWASVRFSGMVRETPADAPVGFEEVWNLVKPTDGSSGWLLAGIQQMH